MPTDRSLLTLETICIVLHFAHSSKTPRNKLAWIGVKNLTIDVKSEYVLNYVIPQANE
jgi:hypothetical protein